MSEKLKAIVIYGNNAKEKDKNILLFTLEKGKIWVTLKGVRGEKAKMKYAKEPFCFGDYIVEVGKVNNVVTAVDIIEDFNDIALDVDKYFEASALLEIVQNLDFEGERQRYEVFMALIKSLKTLAFRKVPKYGVLSKFMLDIFEIYGVKLYSEKCSGCGSEFHDNILLNHDAGEFVCIACRTFRCEKVERGVFNLIKLLSTTPMIPKFSEEIGLATVGLLVRNFYSRFNVSLKFVGILN